MLNRKKNQIAELREELDDALEENDFLWGEAAAAELLEAERSVAAQNTCAALPAPLPREAFRKYVGSWEVHTVDDPPLFVDATWRDVPEASPFFNADLDLLPVVWDDSYLVVQINAGSSITIPMERVTHIDERIVPFVEEPPPPPPAPAPERDMTLGYE